MKKLFAMAVLILPILLTGCVDKIPDQAMTDKAALAYAKSRNAAPGWFDVKNVVRDNGWSEDENHYSVKYTYDLVASRSFDEILVAVTKEDRAELEKSTPQNQKDVRKLRAAMGDLWVGTLSEERKEQVRMLIRTSPAIKTYMAEAKAKGGEAGHDAAIFDLVDAWSNLNRRGLKDDMKFGTTLPQSVTLQFVKTEKGWMQPNEDMQRTVSASDQSAEITAQASASPAPTEINPTTGLPMVNGGGIDVMGNAYGAPGVNPATGLPMAGGMDVGGNAFGTAPATINPATGMGMVGGMGGVDTGGNAFGTGPTMMQ